MPTEQELWLSKPSDVTEMLVMILEVSNKLPKNIMMADLLDKTVEDLRYGNKVDFHEFFIRCGYAAYSINGGSMDIPKFCDMLLTKHKMYGLTSLTRWGIPGIINRIDGKFARYTSMMKQGVTTSNAESIDDTIHDILGYCILGLKMVQLNIGLPHRAPSLLQASGKVGEFHKKHGFELGHSLLDSNVDVRVDGILEVTGWLIQSISKRWERGTSDTATSDSTDYDTRLMRCHLIGEEFGELMIAMAQMDEVKVLDGLADLIYVCLGTAVAWDLPIAAAFDEVHRSNMTKDVKAGGPDDLRCRDKGKSYESPNLNDIMILHRNGKDL